jgi:hypothetical protein
MYTSYVCSAVILLTCNTSSTAESVDSAALGDLLTLPDTESPADIHLVL